MRDTVELANHYTLDTLLEKLRYVLMETQGKDSIELLDKALAKAQNDLNYAKETEKALLHGSTVEIRTLLSVFGDYFEPPKCEFPFYPHHDAVNGIDSAIGTIKYDTIRPGVMQERIDEYKFLHNR